jgi:hypothetical protein
VADFNASGLLRNFSVDFLKLMGLCYSRGILLS